MPTSSEHHTFQFQPVAIVRSVFKEKFAVPRQSGLAPSAQAVIELLPPCNSADYVAGLEQVSHIWLQFVFHQHLNTPARAKVRPPRLGGNQKLGVFATRSPVRPNPIGLSVVALQGIEQGLNGVQLRVAGVDLVDGTPVLDIKPYVPYADSIAGAENLVAPAEPPAMAVVFSENANTKIGANAGLKSLLQEVLAQDPRPKYQAIDTQRVFGALIDNYNVTWRYCLDEGQGEFIEVLDLQQR